MTRTPLVRGAFSTCGQAGGDIEPRHRRRAGTFGLVLALASLATVACESNISPPTAVIAGPSTAVVGEVVQLDGSASQSQGGGTLAFSWRFTTVPASSAAAFPDTTLVAPTLVLDAAGVYVIELVVATGWQVSAPASHTITVTEGGPDGGTTDGGMDAGAPDAGAPDAGTCGARGQPCCDAPSVSCEEGLACVGSATPLCLATDAGVSSGTIDLVYCACVGAPPGVFATLCVEVTACTSGMPAPAGACDSVCANGVVSSSCEPDSTLCN